MEKTLKSPAINYGLYLGLILIAFTVIGYSMSLNMFVTVWFPFLLLIIIATLGILSSIKTKKALGGFISFKETFKAYFIVIVIGLLMANLFNYILFNFIDTESNSILRELIIEAQLEGMEKWGTPQETIDTQRVNLEKEGNFYAIKNVGLNIGFKIIGYSILGLISSLIIRRKDPNAA
ncbi:DUF4199 domain-containing protein [Winogradskyella immobilis]|uniref:DUF4199 domain-containing protein n=1 Tax=Winogradskyella immobilis TaxID=2816852 RepID=A0ABS8EK33_9FLAO|nr:DUF4199 domain-containing protein [Winogradskyella immobilis]MCC1483558.1 DUF4199 domain-containing protein [Winogradskyella immobilis]MCG0015652.1 DUF4199 domain-containing protein [Winogradskyella immobilis]